jgi:hypothetical protein
MALPLTRNQNLIINYSFLFLPKCSNEESESSKMFCIIQKLLETEIECVLFYFEYPNIQKGSAV